VSETLFTILRGRWTVGANVKGPSSLPLAINTRKEQAKGVWKHLELYNASVYTPKSQTLCTHN
jgi:hypothetical protein